MWGREWWYARHARRLLDACHPVRSVLVLCTANRVRSPFAERLLHTALGDAIEASVRPTVFSRGLISGGLACPPEAVAAAGAFGVSLAGHSARQLHPTELLPASLVLVMEQAARDTLVRRFPALAERVVLLGPLDPQGALPLDIVDPMGGTAADFAASYARIARCCRAVAARLAQGGQ